MGISEEITSSHVVSTSQQNFDLRDGMNVGVITVHLYPLTSSALYKGCKFLSLCMLSVSPIVPAFFTLLSYRPAILVITYIVTVQSSMLLVILVLSIQLSMKIHQLIIGVYNLQGFQYLIYHICNQYTYTMIHILHLRNLH